MFDFEDVKPLDYFPGHAASSPKFRIFESVPGTNSKDSIFQIDNTNDTFIKNKKTLLQSKDSDKYFKYTQEFPTQIIDFVKEQLNITSEEDLISIIINKISEDIAIYDVNKNRLENIWLCAPNDWGADLAIGKSFAEIHDHIKGHDGKHIIKSPDKMVKAIMNVDGSVERVGGISFASDKRLNRHPSVVGRKDREFDGNNLFMRVERQTMTPFKDLNMFFFTVKTYFYDCANPKYRDVITDIFTNPHPNLYAKWYVEKYGKEVLQWLKCL